MLIERDRWRVYTDSDFSTLQQPTQTKFSEIQILYDIKLKLEKSGSKLNKLQNSLSISKYLLIEKKKILRLLFVDFFIV